VKNLARHLLGRLVARCLLLRSQPYVLAAGPALILAPHADDETLGCGGLLALKSARGDPVEVAFITDSAGSPEASPAADLAGRRRAEALAALDVLGIKAAQVHFLGAPDGRLNRLTPEQTALVHQSLLAVLTRLQPAEVFTPYFGGGSSEHDAVTRLARTALKASGVASRLWEYPVWAWWDARRLSRQLRQPGQNFFLSLGAARARKQAALACHASQLEIVPATGEPGLSPVLAALCTGPVEFFFLRPA
jgi:LmbE family N-acetylglucosaminyl deacetylase